MRCGTWGKAAVRPRSSVTRTPVVAGDASPQRPARASDARRHQQKRHDGQHHQNAAHGGGFIRRRVLSKVDGKPAAINVTRSHACASLLVEHAQRIDKGTHFAAHGNDAQADLVAHQHHRAWGLLNRY